METQPRGLTAVTDERAILGLPLNGRRFTDLCLLTPGVTQDPRDQTSNGHLAFGGIRAPDQLYGGRNEQQQCLLRPNVEGIALRLAVQFHPDVSLSAVH